MTWYQFLCLIGAPSLFSGAILFIVRNFISHERKHSEETKNKLAETEKKTVATMLGIQALLRAQMISEYNHYHEKGYAPIYARDNFENCWIQYHSLGANGVMDDIHEKFMLLPINKER